MKKILTILGLGVVLIIQLMFNSRLADASEFFDTPRFYISRISSVNGGEFIEIYNNGDDLVFNKLSVFKAASKTEFITLENKIFSGKSYILLSQKGESDYIYEGDHISDSAIIRVKIDDFEFGFCSAGKSCSEGFEHAGFSLDKKHIAISKYELQKHSIENDKEYKKIPLEDNLAVLSLGGLKNQAQVPPQNKEETPPENSGGDSNIPGQPDQPENPKDEAPEKTDTPGNIGGSEELKKPEKDSVCRYISFNEIYANSDEQWIELKNTHSEDIEGSGCVIQVGKKGKKYVISGFEIKASEYFVIDLKEESFKIPKTKADIYLLDESGDEQDTVKYQGLKADSSWSLIDDEWKMTFSPTKNKDNELMEFLPCSEGYVRSLSGRCVKEDSGSHESKPCAEGYYRHPETGRCRKIEEEKQPTPCKEGYERNPETGRCRKIEANLASAKVCAEGYYLNPATNRCNKIAVASTTKTPCREGYYRHPETGRCRKIEEEKQPTPCKEGYERNPETGRCRKIVKNEGAAEKVPDDTNQSSQSEFTGWWALIAVSLVGISLVIWEFRSSIIGLFKSKK